MPFETASAARPRIAVIGAGISGLSAAYLLAGNSDVVLFEAERRLGGHARTVMAGKRGDQPVDTGFIVFNHATYPHLTRLFDNLGVPTVPSNMSFGASFGGGRFEYSLTSLDTVFAQRRNLANPKYLGMLRDIFRFNARAAMAERDPSMTIRELLAVLRTGEWFRDRYLLPLSGAIWSTPTQDVLDFPAGALVRFFRNHALMGYSGQHQWYTVKGGSIEYVRRLEAALRRQGVDIRTGSPIAGVRRAGGTGRAPIMLRPVGGDWEGFDEVVFATHADDTLAMLADASPLEAAALGAVRYQPNEAVLHADPSLMPRRHKVWSSWIYSEEAEKRSSGIDLTYWMNSLQPIPQDDPHFVTLNTTRAIREELIYDTTTFRHPVYDLAALQAQEAIVEMNGTANTWFCGAWMRNGFHEDGFASAVAVAEGLEARRALQRVAA
ncbi:NAD(P)/FAD-dependent oxidoreductase [Alkalilacustris brevis]|uniref:NAD(P)/FAD-dependent oxidoreductase n=1 Tax=Alkalilacustris brevis TaxID=2026338 RepID=UPI000E0DFB80|nr:FAD-dependent oxidoreductase [Alkalilacustris brevis]